MLLIQKFRGTRLNKDLPSGPKGQRGGWPRGYTMMVNRGTMMYNRGQGREQGTRERDQEGRQRPRAGTTQAFHRRQNLLPVPTGTGTRRPILPPEARSPAGHNSYGSCNQTLVRRSSRGTGGRFSPDKASNSTMDRHIGGGLALTPTHDQPPPRTLGY